MLLMFFFFINCTKRKTVARGIFFQGKKLERGFIAG